MYLTDKKNGAPRDMHEHDELEVLLEFFSKQVEEIVNEAGNIEVCYTGKTDLESRLIDITKTNVQSTQEIVELILDSNRNALLALDLKVWLFLSTTQIQCT
jgi:magnesium transporter